MIAVAPPATVGSETAFSLSSDIIGASEKVIIT